ncbi:MAG TPA: hypothetical protein VK918_08325 [Pyrinomonadaceae bacterium]|nr:hypothetical protein [Pyrinomonadaceae bacterium]
MAKKNHTIARKAAHAAGWQVVKRGAKMLPFGGAFIVLALVGTDIKRKGLVKGVANSALDAVPFVGLLKNGVEMITGDFISDKPEKGDRKRRT